VRKLIVTTFATLDGVQEHVEKWQLRYMDEEATKRVHEDLLGSDALVMGRETYEGYAAVWPARAGDEYADTINAIPKYVASTTLEEPLEWNNSTLIKGEVAEEVSRLKQEPGKGILMHGCGSLARELARNGLVDEFRMWVHPVVWGRGGPRERLFHGTDDGVFLELADATPLGSGVVILSYAR
jgi:dihydrofolate reductase